MNVMEKQGNPYDIVWSRVRTKGSPDSFVPGVNCEGNSRPKKPTMATRKNLSKHHKNSSNNSNKVKKKSELKPENKQAERKRHTRTSAGSSTGSHPGSQAGSQAGSSLKDLCAEDKQRVANLIKELARIGEEKEAVEKDAEEKLMTYHKQMSEVERERTDALSKQRELKLKYEEVQSLLVEYQQLLENERRATKRHRNRDSPPRRTSPERRDMATSPVKPLTREISCSPPRHLTPPPAVQDRQLDGVRQLEATRQLEGTGQEPARQDTSVFAGVPDSKLESVRRCLAELSQASQHKHDAVIGRKESHDAASVTTDAGLSFDGMNTTQFKHRYRTLSPSSRHRKLEAQKRALLAEQQRLQRILAEQESILHAKQQQFHTQHAIHSERLEYFERHGRFPDRCELPAELEENNMSRVFQRNLREIERAGRPVSGVPGPGGDEAIHPALTIPNPFPRPDSPSALIPEPPGRDAHLTNTRNNQREPVTSITSTATSDAGLQTTVPASKHMATSPVKFMDSYTDKHTDRHTDIHADRHKGPYPDKLTDRQTDRLTSRQTDIYADLHTDKHTDMVLDQPENPRYSSRFAEPVGLIRETYSFDPSHIEHTTKRSHHSNIRHIDRHTENRYAERRLTSSPTNRGISAAHDNESILSDKSLATLSEIIDSIEPEVKDVTSQSDDTVEESSAREESELLADVFFL